MRKARRFDELLISDIHRRMGRKKQWSEDMVARFPEGTFAAITELLDKGEDRTDFVRAAVAREIKRREREARAGKSSRKRTR